eukprot:403371486
MYVIEEGDPPETPYLNRNPFTPPHEQTHMVRQRQVKRQISFDDENLADPSKRFQMLVNVLRLPANGRNQKDKQIISQLLLDYKYFTELGKRDHDLLLNMSKHLHIVQFKPNDIIANQDQVQDRPLFLLQGDVFMVRKLKDANESQILTSNLKSQNQTVLKVSEFANQLKDATQLTMKEAQKYGDRQLPMNMQKRISKLPFTRNGNIVSGITNGLNQSQENGEEQQQRYVGIIKPGKWLYQLSHHLKLPLHASFVSGPLDTVFCLTLPLEIYKKCIGDNTKKEIQENIKFLSQCGFGGQMQQNNLILLASKMKQIKVKSHTILCKQDEKCSHIYFLKSGCVKLVRDLAFHPIQKYQQQSDSEQIYREDPLQTLFTGQDSNLHSKNNSIYFQSQTVNVDNPYQNQTSQNLESKNQKVSLKPEIHSIQLNNLNSFQSFGVPFSIKDEDAIDIVHGEMLREDFDMNDPLNYSIISEMPTDLIKVKKRYFQSFVKERALISYKNNLATLYPDWTLRKYYIRNVMWSEFKQGFMSNMMTQIKITNSKKLKYLYGNQNAILSSEKVTQASDTRAQQIKKAESEYADNKVRVDLSYLKRNIPGSQQALIRTIRSQSVKPSRNQSKTNLIRNTNTLLSLDQQVQLTTIQHKKYIRDKSIMIENIKLKNARNQFTDQKDLIGQNRKEVKYSINQNDKANEALLNLHKTLLKISE